MDSILPMMQRPDNRKYSLQPTSFAGRSRQQSEPMLQPGGSLKKAMTPPAPRRAASKGLVAPESSGRSVKDEFGGSVWYDQEVGASSDYEAFEDRSFSDGEDSGGVTTSDGGHPSSEKYQRKVDDLMEKIDRVRDQIKTEQMNRDENVDEYLRLTANLSTSSPDNPQLLRVRQMFEKKNHKTAQNILQLQKKLDSYMKRLHDLQSGTGDPKTSRGGLEVFSNVGQNLKDVGSNIKDSISGYTGDVFGSIKESVTALSSASQTAAGTVMSMPKDIAQRILRQKSGSADNIPLQAASAGAGVDGVCNTERLANGKDPGDSDSYSRIALERRATSPEEQKWISVLQYGSPDSSGARESYRPGPGSAPPGRYSPTPPRQVFTVEPILVEMRQIKIATQETKDSIEALRQQVQQEYAYFHQALHEEKYRYQKLEDQMNDLTELHQAEMLNLKQEIGSMEDKISYQHNERLSEINDSVEHAHTRISKLEHAQQTFNLEGFQPTSSIFALKAFNILIIFLQCILVIISTFAQAVVPFLKTRVRVLTSMMVLLLLIYMYRHRSDIGRLVSPWAHKYGLNMDTVFEKPS